MRCVVIGTVALSPSVGRVVACNCHPRVFVAVVVVVCRRASLRVRRCRLVASHFIHQCRASVLVPVASWLVVDAVVARCRRRQPQVRAIEACRTSLCIRRCRELFWRRLISVGKGAVVLHSCRASPRSSLSMGRQLVALSPSARGVGPPSCRLVVGRRFRCSPGMASSPSARTGPLCCRSYGLRVFVTALYIGRCLMGCLRQGIVLRAVIPCKPNACEQGQQRGGATETAVSDSIARAPPRTNVRIIAFSIYEGFARCRSEVSSRSDFQRTSALEGGSPIDIPKSRNRLWGARPSGQHIGVRSVFKKTPPLKDLRIILNQFKQVAGMS